MTDEILYPLKEGTPEQRLQPLMEKYWSELGRWRFEFQYPQFDNGEYSLVAPSVAMDTPSVVLDKIRLVRIPRTITVEIPEPREVIPEFWCEPRDVILHFSSREQAKEALDAIKEAK